MSKKNQISHVIAPDRIFYWAYGSNLCVRQMQRRCPAAIKYGPMSVNDCALVFRHVADVTTRDGAVTPGGLWQITARCERALDQYEGVAGGAYMKRYLRITIANRQHTCLLYQMRTKDGVMPPSQEYLGTIAEGYQDFGLDLGVLDAYLQESWGAKDVTEDLEDRHLRRGSPLLARDLLDAKAPKFRRPPMWEDVHE
jgi:hypothetical protein